MHIHVYVVYKWCMYGIFSREINMHVVICVPAIRVSCLHVVILCACHSCLICVPAIRVPAHVRF